MSIEDLIELYQLRLKLSGRNGNSGETIKSSIQVQADVYRKIVEDLKTSELTSII